jgi:hypothetical protein
LVSDWVAKRLEMLLPHFLILKTQIKFHYSVHIASDPHVATSSVEGLVIYWVKRKVNGYEYLVDALSAGYRCKIDDTVCNATLISIFFIIAD